MRKSKILSPGRLTLITGERGFTHRRMHELIVDLALEGPVKLLIGGNRYDHYAINYAIAVSTFDYERILAENIILSRAETCYQMVELLIDTEAGESPTLVLDLLNTFYDESTPDQEVNQLLFEAITHLRRLSGPSPLVVSAHAREGRPHLLKVLEKAVDQVERPPLRPILPIRQRGLFE